MDQYKYVVLFPIPEPDSGHIRTIMDDIASITGIKPPHHKLPPHVTFHKPLTGIKEDLLENLVMSMVLQMKPTRLVLHDLFPFGKEFIVLPVQATRCAAQLWVGIDANLSRLPKYEHGKYDGDNTLHVTVAEETSLVFDRVWKTVKRKVRVTPMEVLLDKICLYRKPIEGGVWDLVRSFPFPR
ncbi:MAG: hypothetical protein Q7T37_00285 [bacterium]|nr:hypothetical protein [bacterium]MDO8742513.1 hypothetical protein [bacterium]